MVFEPCLPQWKTEAIEKLGYGLLNKVFFFLTLFSCLVNKESTFLRMDSQTTEFRNYMANNRFDVIFIDGDHSYMGVKNDYESSKESGKIYVFHDIVSDACPGVVEFWNELKSKESDTYIFYEFTEQYEEVWNSTQQKFLGIGVAVKK